MVQRPWLEFIYKPSNRIIYLNQQKSNKINSLTCGDVCLLGALILIDQRTSARGKGLSQPMKTSYPAHGGGRAYLIESGSAYGLAKEYVV
jgi:hypothetical protein